MNREAKKAEGQAQVAGTADNSVVGQLPAPSAPVSEKPSEAPTPRTDALMELVDAYADAFHGAMRPDGGIQFADGLVAKIKKDEVRKAIRQLERELAVANDKLWHMQAELNSARALEAAQSARAAIPEGWVLVPREPTKAMREAGGDAIDYGQSAVYRAMLAAAPTVNEESK